MIRILKRREYQQKVTLIDTFYSLMNSTRRDLDFLPFSSVTHLLF